MKHPQLSLIAASLLMLPGIGMANDFSTVTRVQFVMECIQLNDGKMNLYEATHKCSCVVDKLAEVLLSVNLKIQIQVSSCAICPVIVVVFLKMMRM